MSESNRLRRVAAQMAERYGVDPELFVRLVERESNFDPAARGAAGEIGLTQIMAETGLKPGFGVTPIQDRLDPVDNLRFGAEYLSKLVDYYGGDYGKALMAYNGGAGNVDKGKPSKGAQKYATELLGGKETTATPQGSAGLIPQAKESMSDLDRGIAGLFKDQGGLTSARPLGSRPPPSGRYGQSGRMSPLSGVGIPGLGVIQQYSTPGGVESLYRRA